MQASAHGHSALGSLTDLGALVRWHWRIPLYRNAYTLTFGVATTSGLGMLYWLLAARLYAVDVVGKSAAVIAAMSLLSGIAALQLDAALIRFLPRAGEASGQLVSVALTVSAAVAAVAGIIFLFGIGSWSSQLDFLQASSWLSAGFVLSTAASSSSVVQDGALVGMRAVSWTPVKAFVFGVAKIGLLVVFAAWAPAEGILASWMIPLVAVTVGATWLLFARLLPAHRRATDGECEAVAPASMLRYVGGNYVASLFQLATTYALPLLVLHRAGSTASAYFYLPWMIASSLRLVANNMSASLVLEGVSDRHRLAAYGRQAILQTARLLGPVIVVLLIAAPLILRVIGTSYAEEGTTLLRLLVLAAAPNIACVLYIGLARVRDRVASIAMVQAAIAALSLGLSYVLLPDYGLTGVGLAWLATQTLLAAVLIRTQLWPLLRVRDEPSLHPVVQP
jgi:O-antigen/teichoic acid export membrane protein